MDAQFTYDDIVRIAASAPSEMRPGERAWVIGVHLGDRRPSYREFAPGPVYSVEFEGGDAIDVEETFLEPASD